MDVLSYGEGKVVVITDASSGLGEAGGYATWKTHNFVLDTPVSHHQTGGLMDKAVESNITLKTPAYAAQDAKAAIDFKRKLFCEQFGDTTIQNGFISVKPLYMLIVGSPPHPLRFRREGPLVRIEIGNQTQFDFGLTEVSAIIGIGKL
jgi:hypothetical protein